MLVGTNDGGINMMCLPIQLARSVSFGLHVGKDAVPDTGFFPAVEPGRDGGRRTIVCRQVGPRCAGPKNPEDAVDNRSIIVARATPFTPFGWAWRWKQRLQSLPLCVSQISSMHTDSLPKGLRMRPSIGQRQHSPHSKYPSIHHSHKHAAVPAWDGSEKMGSVK